MNLTSAQCFLNKGSQHPRLRLGQKFFAVLFIFLLTAVPALAEPVKINQVVQTLSSSQGTPDLRLKTLVSQDPVAKGVTPKSGPGNDPTTGTQGGTKTESIISGVMVVSETPSLGVDVVEEGEVDGTICDCGEILVAGGAFPKWPLLFLAAVPLVFINDCDNCDSSTSTPTPTPTPPGPTPTPTPTPEPASLFLFGSALAAAGAGLRRRYAKSKLAEQAQTKEEE